MIENTINQDLRGALLSGNKDLVRVLRFIKSIIQDYKVNNNLDRQLSLDDNKILMILTKEIKKMSESLDIYLKINDQSKITESKKEIEIVSKYLPAPATPIKTIIYKISFTSLATIPPSIVGPISSRTAEIICPKLSSGFDLLIRLITILISSSLTGSGKYLETISISFFDSVIFD